MKSVNRYKYLGLILDTELSDNKDIQRQLRYQHCAANKLRVSFSRCLNAVKNVLFRSLCTPMYASHYGVISERYACRDCVWLTILNAELYTTCPEERVLVAIGFNVTFPHLKHWCENTSPCFWKDAEGLKTYGCVLWCSQIVYIRPYSLNTTTVFYFVTECSDIAVFVRLRVCTSQCLRTLPGLDRFRNWAVVLYQVLRVI